jgi:hypothetical protein
MHGVIDRFLPQGKSPASAFQYLTETANLSGNDH